MTTLYPELMQKVAASKAFLKALQKPQITKKSLLDWLDHRGPGAPRPFGKRPVASTRAESLDYFRVPPKLEQTKATVSKKKLRKLVAKASRKGKAPGIAQEAYTDAWHAVKKLGLDPMEGKGLKLYNHLAGKATARNIAEIRKKLPKGWKLRGIGLTKEPGLSFRHWYAGTQAKGPKGQIVEDLGVIPKNLEKATGVNLFKSPWTTTKFEIQGQTKPLPLGHKNRRSWTTFKGREKGLYGTE